jgi:hypothetical protein
MNDDKLTNGNFLVYCAKHYNHSQYYSTSEFIEDIQRIKYIKKLITRYIQTGELKERLILNHIIILCNLFGPEHLTRILYLKCKDQFEYVKPFLILLNILPNRLYNIGNEDVIDVDSISMNQAIVNVLRDIKNG